MYETLFQYYVAIFMVAVTIAMIVWFQGGAAAASAGRLMRMIKRVGLDAGIFGRRDLQTQTTMKQARCRCLKCPREDVCERWLAGEIKGGNAFCPNARAFDLLKSTTVAAG